MTNKENAAGNSLPQLFIQDAEKYNTFRLKHIHLINGKTELCYDVLQPFSFSETLQKLQEKMPDFSRVRYSEKKKVISFFIARKTIDTEIIKEASELLL